MSTLNGRHPDERSARYLGTRPADDPLVVASGLIAEAFALQDAGRFAEAGALLGRADGLTADPEYADVDEDGQLALGVVGEQRAIPGLARPRGEA
jgi:hypothetical protein